MYILAPLTGGALAAFTNLTHIGVLESLEAEEEKIPKLERIGSKM
jgi:hypothetical protein